MRKSYLAFGALWMAFTFAGCLTVKNFYENDAEAYAPVVDGTDPDEPGDVSTKAGRLKAVKALWKAHSCGTTGCHTSGGTDPYVDGLTDEEWTATAYVIAGDAAGSPLWGILKHSGCGNGDCSMPKNYPTIPDADMLVIRDWIDKMNVEDTP